MKTIQVGKYKIELFDSIDELPITRFHKFNKYVLVDAGIGSDLNDIDGSLIKINQYLNKSDLDKAKIEVQNLRESLFLISQETNIKHLSLILLIHKINGVEIFDLSDENIRKIQKKIGEIQVGFLRNILESIKKKLDSELTLYFPSQFNDTALKEYYERFKSRVLLQLDTIIRRNDNEKAIERIDDFLLSWAKPRIFFGKENVEIKYDKQFEEMCLFLQSELNVDVQKMSVLQFYNSFEYLKKLKTTKNGHQSHKIQ